MWETSPVMCSAFFQGPSWKLSSQHLTASASHLSCLSHLSSHIGSISTLVMRSFNTCFCNCHCGSGTIGGTRKQGTRGEPKSLLSWGLQSREGKKKHSHVNIQEKKKISNCDTRHKHSKTGSSDILIQPSVHSHSHHPPGIFFPSWLAHHGYFRPGLPIPCLLSDA